jgi:hypothetical protein
VRCHEADDEWTVLVPPGTEICDAPNYGVVE